LIHRFEATRKNTVYLCEGLEIEDMVVQPYAEVSPPKWHLAHTTWFLEELILNKNKNHYSFYNEKFRKLFNSYYKCLGEHWVQGTRGTLSRPTVNEILEYRRIIDELINDLAIKEKENSAFSQILELAINHEEQHQELMLMDIKRILAENPLHPVYQKTNQNKIISPLTSNQRCWINISEGIYEIGADESQFAFDNEGPRHKVYLENFSLSNNLVTNSEYLEFIEDHGYSQPKLWLSLGWDWVKKEKIISPLYWVSPNEKKAICEFTMQGLQPLKLSAPVSHISYFEADAFARWKGMRLPTEAEFEVCAVKNKGLTDVFKSQLWCWTKSHYSPYPRYKTFAGELQEYNGKFMCNQFVLKGGCMATPKGHYRNTYRNFYGPEQRWMYSGIALAKDEI
jgi:ergothioneine biosynthesis protein EgtB